MFESALCDLICKNLTLSWLLSVLFTVKPFYHVPVSPILQVTKTLIEAWA